MNDIAPTEFIVTGRMLKYLIFAFDADWYKIEQHTTINAYININVLVPEAHIVGEKDITILEANPNNSINIVRTEYFLLSNA